MFERRKDYQTIKGVVETVETKRNEKKVSENQRPFHIVDTVRLSVIICVVSA